MPQLKASLMFNFFLQTPIKLSPQTSSPHDQTTMYARGKIDLFGKAEVNGVCNSCDKNVMMHTLTSV